jgi:MGT family glycosyltransferase
MTRFLMTTWDGAGATPPLMSVARALIARGHEVRVLADPVLRDEVEAAGAEHIDWNRAPHRKTRDIESHFVRHWDAGPEGFARMRDNLAVGPAAPFAADVREQLQARPTDCLLTELLIFGPQVAAEAAGVPYVVLNPTINIVPAAGVPPFGQGLMPAANEAERERDRVAAEMGVQAWDEALAALNGARNEQGLPPLEHVVDQYRAAAAILVMTSAAFDFMGELPPTVKHVGPRLEDPSWAGEWSPPAGEQPLVLVALSSDFQRQKDLLRRIVLALGQMPVRGVVTTGKGVEPRSLPAPPNVQVVRTASHAAVLNKAAAVITHCGHGTTIKALAAGLPIVCIPMGRDQYDVAARVVHRGAGVQVDVAAAPETIAAAVREVLDRPRYAEAARHIADAIHQETAHDRVIDELEALVGARPAAA